MSLYGLDFVKAKDGRYFLIEANGINSGMEGFKKIYGDNRVQDKVVGMLRDKYPKLEYNVGTYTSKKWVEKNERKLKTMQVLTSNKLMSTPLLYLARKTLDLLQPGWVDSELAETDYVAEWSQKTFDSKEPFWPEKYGIAEYSGETDAAVIDLANENLVGVKTINGYVEETLTQNKFFHYILLNNTEIQQYLPISTLVGMGSTDEGTILSMAKDYKKFAVKPIIGKQGVAVKFMNSEELLQKYAGSSGPVTKDPALMRRNNPLKGNQTLKLENLAMMKKFGFEQYLSLVQPFINSKTSKNSKYKSIRAIVCNGKFVDAYSRVSDSRVVNLARGSDAEAFNHDAKFRGLSEKVVKCLEEEAQNLPATKFRELIYFSYLTQIRKMNKELGFSQEMPEEKKKNILQDMSIVNHLVLQYMTILVKKV